MDPMHAIQFYSWWMFVTTAWSLISGESKNQAIGRYVFTFIFISIVYFYNYVK